MCIHIYKYAYVCAAAQNDIIMGCEVFTTTLVYVYACAGLRGRLKERTEKHGAPHPATIDCMHSQ
jgi:hypothetical protein